MTDTIRYLRFAAGGSTAYGLLDGETVHEFDGDPFSGARETDRHYRLGEVTLLPPCRPSKVIAVGLNYRSHLRGRPEPEYPGIFAKFPSTLTGHESPIVLPSDEADVHYESTRHGPASSA